MSWNAQRALSRINELKKSVPSVEVERFEDQYMPRYGRLLAEASTRGQRIGSPLAGLTNTQAVLVDGVHVYANLVNFDDFLLKDARETEQSHKSALQFLHLHYASADRAVEACGAQRVDFHGQRLHAVVVEPAGAANRAERVRRALVLADAMQNLASSANTRLGTQLGARYRIGIDTGVCVAIRSGRGTEREPLFLGNAANYAAKLAEGDQPGVFVSDTVAATLSGTGLGTAVRQATRRIDERATFDASLAARSAGASASFDSESLVESWLTEIRQGRAPSLETFAFHYHQPPLRSIDYANLMPSNSIRMTLISMFADIDGYTAYVEGAMSSVSGTAEAVRNLHVIRGEMAAVLRDDFEGKRVRFVGDCIHGLYAVGNAREVDHQETVSRGVHLAGAIRSSFDLCRSNLNGVQNLGLAIGLELGETPISRVGVRGDASVRVAVSKATAKSEECQAVSDGQTTAIGPQALATASSAVRRLFASGSARNLDYDTALFQIPVGNASPAMPAVAGSPGYKSHVV